MVELVVERSVINGASASSLPQMVYLEAGKRQSCKNMGALGVENLKCSFIKTTLFVGLPRPFGP